MRPIRALLPVLALLAVVPSLAAQTRTAIRRGTPVAASLAANDTARFSISFADSTFVLGAVRQTDEPLALRVMTAAGQQRARFQGPGTGDLRYSGIVAAAGEYVIEVFAPSHKATRFTLRLDRQEPVARDPRRRADQLIARYDAPDTPGAVLRVWRDGRTLYSKAYGTANLAYAMPYRVDTRTNIGSTSKQFTAFAILLQAERGALSLDDDIRKHIPELPDLGDTVRVRHLVTHTSGLREIFNLIEMSERNAMADWIDRDELIEVVQRQPKLQNEPGTEFNYNNTAFGLAALIVARTSGKDFATYMRDEVFLPLGMTRSMVRSDRNVIVPDGAPGYIPTAEGYRESGDLAAAMGAGGIYTTVEDLERWAQNMDSPTPKVGTRAIFDRMMTDSPLKDGKASGYGMGLFVDTQRGQRRVHHGGADIAHRSMLVLYPDINAGVSLQSNHAAFSYAAAFEIAEAFFADAFKDSTTAVASSTPASSYDPASMTAARFAGLEGRFALVAAPAFVLRFFRDGSTFYTQATGQPRIAMVPTSDSTFKLTGVEASLRFQRGANGRAESVILVQNGEQRANRLPDSPGEGRPAVNLADFAGRYHSEELDSWMTLVVRGDSLIAEQRRREDARLAPDEAKADTFAGRNLTFTFERDRNGQVIGFYVSNGRTRDVRFERARP
ncbi:MAG: beta-lactamase family protein [Gemmatimonadaceae bacterium]|nr:beta-lactamase family protein [Gemmatimonadaceae bacterium]